MSGKRMSRFSTVFANVDGRVARGVVGLVAVAFALVGQRAGAEILIPTSYSASSVYPVTPSEWDVAHLFDSQIAITEAAIGTSYGTVTPNTSNTDRFGQSWAFDPNSGTIGVLVLDMGQSYTMDGLLYAQRVYGDGGAATNDTFTSANIWVETSDPGSASLALPGTLGAADVSNLALTTSDKNLNSYSFGSTYPGQWVVIQFTGASGSPGGQELRITAVPEPSSLLLMAAAALPAAAVAFRRRPRWQDRATADGGGR